MFTEDGNAAMGRTKALAMHVGNVFVAKNSRNPQKARGPHHSQKHKAMIWYKRSDLVSRTVTKLKYANA